MPDYTTSYTKVSGLGKPILYDLFCGAGGATRGYQMAGYAVLGIDNKGFPRYCGDAFIEMDAMEFIAAAMRGEIPMPDMWAASPPCQGYSVMNNLPWICSRTYPLLILPLRELLEEIGLPYVIENVAGAASKKNLAKLGLLEHRLRAGWLCGGMFGLPIYRHRYFETNFFWLQPGHPKHVRTGRGSNSAHDGQGAIAASPFNASLTRGQRGIHKPEDVRKRPALHLPTVHAETRRRSHLSEKLPGVHGKSETEYKGSWDRDKHTNPIGSASGKASLNGWDNNGAQKEGVADGHAAGWRVAAAAMGIDWMKRSELTQAIPPCMTEHIGKWSPAILRSTHE